MVRPSPRRMNCGNSWNDDLKTPCLLRLERKPAQRQERGDAERLRVRVRLGLTHERISTVGSETIHTDAVGMLPLK